MKCSNRGLAVLLVACVASTGCATTNRTKTLSFMLGVGAASAVAGYATAPNDEKPGMHAVYWGAVGAAAAGALGLFLFDEQKRSEEAFRQNEALKKELDSYRVDAGGAIGTGGAEFVVEGSPKFNRDIPDELKPYVRRGQWKYSRLPTGRWYVQGDSQMSRQCLETFQLVAPSFKSGSADTAPHEFGERPGPASESPSLLNPPSEAGARPGEALSNHPNVTKEESK